MVSLIKSTIPDPERKRGTQTALTENFNNETANFIMNVTRASLKNGLLLKGFTRKTSNLLKFIEDEYGI